MEDIILKSRSQLSLYGIICFFLITAFGSVHAYDYPVGIPDAWVEPDTPSPSRPSSWSSEVPGYFYVNYQTGSDNNNYGTPNSPRRTIPNPIPAGSYVEVSGEYNHLSAGVIQVWGAGNGNQWVANQSGPAWIVGDPNNIPEFTGEKFIISGSYVYLSHVRVHSGSRLQVGSYAPGEAADHVLIRGVDVEGLTSDGTGSIMSTVGLSSADSISNVIVYDSVFHDTGNLSSSSDDDADIFNIDQFSSYVWILDNTMHTASGGGVQVNPTGGSSDTHHIFVGRNHVYNVRQAGLWVKFGTDVVFSENLVHDILTTSWSSSKGIGAQYEPQRLWMLNNTIYNVEYGVRVASTYGNTDWLIYTIGNVIYDAHAPGLYSGSSSWDEACIHMHGGGTHFIANNTLVDCDAGINLSSTSSNYIITNNIISNVSETSGNHIWIEYQESDTTIDNNLFYQNGSEVRLKAGANLHDLNSFVSIYGKCINCQNEDPVFLLGSPHTYAIPGNSPAADTGSLDQSIYNDFLNRYGASLMKDILGNPRVQGSIIDRGAYESIGDLGNAPPSPPTMVSVE